MTDSPNSQADVASNPVDDDSLEHGPSDPISNLVKVFLGSNLSIVLIIVAAALGLAALLMTPREEDPQIVVPLADVYVSFPGHSAAEVEQLVTSPLERMLYQIDGVEYVYSMSQDDQAVITVRFYVGQDRERSLVKLFKRLQENNDAIPPGVAGWVMKPVEIDDVPIVALTLTRPGSDGHDLRRLGEELVERLSVVPRVSRATVIGGQSRTVSVDLNADRLAAHGLTPSAVANALRVSTVTVPAGDAVLDDTRQLFAAGSGVIQPSDLGELVIGVYDSRPVFLKDVATLRDGPEEVESYVRHGWGPARGFHIHDGAASSVLGAPAHGGEAAEHGDASHGDASHAGESGAEALASSEPAVTITVSKQKGSNAVTVAESILRVANELRAEVLPDDVEMIVTRNSGMVADEKVDELIEALGVAIIIVILLLTIGLGWREAIIVAIAVPVVFGLTLAVNLLAGYTINRVTLFALILSLGMLVDDPIVDVENIARHFGEKGKRSRRIVLDAVSEIRPPLISATFAVIVSFLPMFFITGMMGPYMSPMALNVPVSMLMSMLVAFTITPWLSYHLLRPHKSHGASAPESTGAAAAAASHGGGQTGPQEFYDPEVIKRTYLYRPFRPMMLVMLRNKLTAIAFLLGIFALTVAASALAATRSVPLKMLPFDNKNEWLLVVDMPENASLEQTDAAIRDLEQAVSIEPEVTDYTSYVGVAGPIDFNGLVRHYALRELPHQAEIRVNFVGKRYRQQQSHGLALRLRERLEEIGENHGALVRIVELPPGPPVLASLVAEVRGRADLSYDDILGAADRVADRFRLEPGVVEIDEVRETPVQRWTFVTDQEKAAVAGVSVAEIAETIRIAVHGVNDVTLRTDHERQPLRVMVRLPREDRTHVQDLLLLRVRSSSGGMVPLAELGQWVQADSGQTIHHKNLQRVAYVMAECVGRPPAECVVDILADQESDPAVGVARDAQVVPVADRTYLRPGGGVAWSLPEGTEVTFAGEGEWKITLDVFRDLGLAFGAAMVMIYVILVAQTGSFVVPIIVMMAIPLTVLGVMPGFWLLNQISGAEVGGFADPVFFTATAMIGMIALAGIVTRDSIILVDFMEMAVKGGRPLFDAILESRVVRLRPILLTAGAAMLSSLPITLDPIFSGLGWSLIFGLIASTIFTLFVIPATYWLLKVGKVH
ncbi:MAG: efflux RND transporter permease subunit [Pirellulaceae bacterium]